MKYKVTAVETAKIKVEYADGSWAEFPTVSTDEKDVILKNIKNYSPDNPHKQPWDSVDKVPVQVDFEGDTETDRDYTIQNPDGSIKKQPTDWTYARCRGYLYPEYGDQFDAAYKARQGDSTEQIEIDKEIAQVKKDWPKTLAPMTTDEFKARIQSLNG